MDGQDDDDAPRDLESLHGPRVKRAREVDCPRDTAKEVCFQHTVTFPVQEGCVERFLTAFDSRLERWSVNVCITQENGDSGPFRFRSIELDAYEFPSELPPAVIVTEVSFLAPDGGKDYPSASHATDGVVTLGRRGSYRVDKDPIAMAVNAVLEDARASEYKMKLVTKLYVNTVYYKADTNLGLLPDAYPTDPTVDYRFSLLLNSTVCDQKVHGSDGFRMYPRALLHAASDYFGRLLPTLHADFPDIRENGLTIDSLNKVIMFMVTRTFEATTDGKEMELKEGHQMLVLFNKYNVQWKGRVERAVQRQFMKQAVAHSSDAAYLATILVYASHHCLLPLSEVCLALLLTRHSSKIADQTWRDAMKAAIGYGDRTIRKKKSDYSAWESAESLLIEAIEESTHVVTIGPACEKE